MTTPKKTDPKPSAPTTPHIAPAGWGLAYLLFGDPNKNTPKKHPSQGAGPKSNLPAQGTSTELKDLDVTGKKAKGK